MYQAIRTLLIATLLFLSAPSAVFAQSGPASEQPIRPIEIIAAEMVGEMTEVTVLFDLLGCADTLGDVEVRWSHRNEQVELDIVGMNLMTYESQTIRCLSPAQAEYTFFLPGSFSLESLGLLTPTFFGY